MANCVSILGFTSKDNILIQAIEETITKPDVKMSNTPVNELSSLAKSFENA